MSDGAAMVEPLDPTVAGEDIRSRWRALAVARENPFLTPEWMDAWLEAGGGRWRPLVLAWRREPGAPPAAVLPLVLGGGAVRKLRYPGADNGDWFGIACEAGDEGEAAAAFLAALRERRREWDMLRLDRVPPAPWPGMRRLRGDALPYLELGEGGYEGWLASRSRNFRSQLGRRRRRVEREHELAFADTPGRDGLGPAVERLFELHAARRRMQGGEGVLSEEARRAYSRFAELSLERGWLRMHSLSLDGEVAAAWYGWRLGERYLYGISGFDPAQEALALGTVLLAHTIECAAEEGARVYDFLWGEEGYKDRFATGRREVASLAAAGGLRGRLALAGLSGRERLARALSPEARARLRRLRGGGGR